MPAYVTDRRRASRAGTSTRRTRHRLRELCDEVLASYRVATERDPMTPEERDEARRMLAHLAPRAPLPRR